MERPANGGYVATDTEQRNHLAGMIQFAERPANGGNVARGIEHRDHFAGIAQLVERNLAKVDVAGSSPVSRSSRCNIGIHQTPPLT